jgi:hypothetical protein
MDSGRPCGSPPLTRGRYCYWHNRLHTEHHFPGNPKYQPPILDSPNAVLLALNHVFRAQSLGMIDERTARELRSALRLAFQIVRHLDTPKPEEIITDLEHHLGPGTVVTPTKNDITRSAADSPALPQQETCPVGAPSKPRSAGDRAFPQQETCPEGTPSKPCSAAASPAVPEQTCPEGTPSNSPALQRRVASDQASSAVGTTENPFSCKPPQPANDFTRLIDSPSADQLLPPEQERKLRSLVHNGPQR